MNEIVYKIENIVRLCGNKMLECDINSINIEKKEGRGNIVTNYDKEIQNILKFELSKLISDANFICEENDIYDGIIDRGYTFIIDPIDGTINFSRSYGLSAISVALFKNGKPFVSVCYNPYKDEMFVAELNKGAYLNGRRIKVSDRGLSNGIVLAGNAPYRSDLQIDSLKILSKLMKYANDYRRIGSAVIEMCSIACGRAEVYYELDISIWDYAAAYLIVIEAGGIVSDINGNDISFDKASSIIVSNKMEDYLKYLGD